MHRIEEGLHLHSFGNVKTVLCVPIQGRVRETLNTCSPGTCFSWLPATGACLAMGTLSANLSPSPIFVFVHCSAGARHKRTGRARAYGTVRDYWLLFLASIVVPQPLSSYAGVPEGGEQGWTRRRDTALVPSERGASKIVKAVYTEGRREKRSTVRTAQVGLMAIRGSLLPSGQSRPHFLSPSLPCSPVSVNVGSPLAGMSG